MSAAFTPGPWFVTADECGVMSEGRCVAKLDWNIRDHTDKANARLIAAAPELYEALETLLERGFMLGAGPARAALAKARGEQA